MCESKYYELKVFDDGDVAVRTISKQPLLPTTLIFDDSEALKTYLAHDLEIRWSLLDVLSMIHQAPAGEWVEFK